MDIFTYSSFEDLFLLNRMDVDCLVNSRMENFDPVESICFSSFLNMIFQTTSSEDLFSLQIKELEALLMRSLQLSKQPIIFHRDNLLHFISLVIANKINGKNKITGETNRDNSLKYYQTLILINNKINFLQYQNFEREILKSFPYSDHKILFHYYKQRIIRYSIIYDIILSNELHDNQKDLLVSGIELVEEKYKLNFKGYMDVIKGLFVWFLGAKERGINSNHFKKEDISTFYILADNFKGSPEFISTIEALSLDLTTFDTEFKKERKDKIDNGIYCYFQTFFDYPIFKINENEFCILDFKFLVEGICSGLIWKIDSIIKNNDLKGYSIQAIKEQYGYLLENYFCFLVKEMFSDIKVTFEQEGMPDCILEINVDGEDCVILFEFTTKNYRISSLYNKSSDNFIDDLCRILFSTVRNDKGKFININKYMNLPELKNKKIIPVLLTENFIGDFDLLNRFNNILYEKINEHNLENLKEAKPVILNLDDLETFWAISSHGKENEEFYKLLSKWEHEEKGKYLYNFAAYASENKRIKNDNYAKYFSFNKI